MVAMFKTAGGGISMCFPDICKTPAPPAPLVPMPYPNPNLGNATNKAAAEKTKLAKKSMVTKSSGMSRTSGDSAGTLKGMMAPVNSGKVRYKSASSTVKVQGTRSKMANAHQQLMSFNGSESPDAWQAAIESYLLAASAAYIQLNED